MPKLFFIIMMCIGVVLGLILVIENMIGSVGTMYTLVWVTRSETLILFTLFCGILIGYGFKGLISYTDDDENSENF